MTDGKWSLSALAQDSLLKIHPHRRHRRAILPRPNPVRPDPVPRLQVELHTLHYPRSRLCLRRDRRGRRHRIQDTFRSALDLPPAKISKYWRGVARVSLIQIFSFLNLTIASGIL